MILKSYHRLSQHIQLLLQGMIHIFKINVCSSLEDRNQNSLFLKVSIYFFFWCTVLVLNVEYSEVLFIFATSFEKNDKPCMLFSHHRRSLQICLFQIQNVLWYYIVEDIFLCMFADSKLLKKPLFLLLILNPFNRNFFVCRLEPVPWFCCF